MFNKENVFKKTRNMQLLSLSLSLINIYFVIFKTLFFEYYTFVLPIFQFSISYSMIAEWPKASPVFCILSSIV